MKFKIEIEETIAYRHEITVECDNEITASRIADEIEESAEGTGDFEILCENKGGKLIDFCEDESGEAEYECTGIDEIEESEVEK